MRQITRDSVRAFQNLQNFKRGNVRVDRHIGGVSYFLHGNRIALQHCDSTYPELSDCGWHSNTTKDRLNAILSRYRWYIYQQDHKWYLASQWHGEELPWRDRVDVEDLVAIDRRIMAEREERAQGVLCAG